MNTYRYTLEKYRGLSTRYTCPQCGRKHTFTRYIDTENNNQYISDNVGKCNRLDKCGYHYTPRQYFTDNPHKSENRDMCSFVRTNRENERTNANRGSSRPAPPKPTVSVLPTYALPRRNARFRVVKREIKEFREFKEFSNTNP